MYKNFILTEEEKQEILNQHIVSGYKKTIVKEQTETYNFNMAIQCFLNKKGVKDNANQALKMDGSIGNYPQSKSAQAIYRYQDSLGAVTDGVWGEETYNKMPEQDKKIFKACVSEHGNLIDKGLHMLGLD